MLEFNVPLGRLPDAVRVYATQAGASEARLVQTFGETTFYWLDTGGLVALRQSGEMLTGDASIADRDHWFERTDHSGQLTHDARCEVCGAWFPCDDPDCFSLPGHQDVCEDCVRKG
jgi:hypothetical protein